MKKVFNGSLKRLGVCAVIVLFGIFYVYKGLPFPHIDDLVIVGVAKNIASGGGLKSAHVAPDFYKTVGNDMFYYYAPFYVYIVSLWIKIFNCSVVSLQAFSFLMNLIGAAAIFQIGRFLNVSGAFLYATSAMYFVFFASLGLRSEVTAISLLFLGGYLLLKFKNPFFGLLSLLLSVLVYPVTAPSGILMIAYSIHIRYHQNKKEIKNYILTLMGFSVFVVILCTICFGWMIDWDFAEFLRVYQIQIQTQNPGILFSPERFYRYIDLLTSNSKYLPKLPFVLIGLLVCLASAFYKKIPLHTRVFAVVSMAGVILGAGLAHVRSIEFSLLISFVCISFVAGSISNNQSAFKFFSLCAIVFLFCCANSLSVFRILFQKNISTKVDFLVEEIVLQSNNGKCLLLIDPAVARYVFNWNLPVNAYDITMSRDILDPAEKRIFPRTKSDLHSGEIAILSKTLYEVGWGHSGPSKLRIFGKTIPPINLYACEPFVVTNQ